MRYVFYVLGLVLAATIYLNNSADGRRLKHRLEAAGESSVSQYRGD
jgi:hypothetical protein